SATLNITDNDTATVSIATTRDGNESGPVSGLFTVSLTQASATDTVISYTVGGTAVSGADFTPLSGSLTIPKNQLSATITVPVIDDALVEGTETVSVTLTAITSGAPQIALGAANSATLNIADNDTSTLSITTTRDGNESGPVSGLFTVSLTQASATDTVISYSVGGTASSGADFTALSGSVTIPANQLSATITVAVLDDALVERSEERRVGKKAISRGEPQNAQGAANSATLSIADNDTSTVSIATTRDGNETGPVSGLFSVLLTRVGATDTVISYSVGGTASSGADFTPLSGSVTIPANQLSATITVAVLDDALVE